MAKQVDQEGLGQEAGRRSVRPRLRTVLVCDLAESTSLVERLGDARAADLMRRHDRMCRELLRTHGGREVDKSDGFLVLFDRPLAATEFALEYLGELAALGQAEGLVLSARVGIHFGEVFVWRNDEEIVASGAARLAVEGLTKPVAARLAHLAMPGQVLLSEVAHALARRACERVHAAGAALSWAEYGPYRLKGIAEPVGVYGVARADQGVLRAPPGSAKAAPARAWSRRPWLFAAPVAAVLVLAVLIGLFSVRAPEAIAFRERDWVVIGALENHTGDPRFNGALEAALRASLEQSRHVNVLPESRVREALVRMTRGADTEVNRPLGTEIALREGVRALLVPTIAEVGSRLMVGIDVVDPVSGRTVHSRSKPTPSVEDSLGVLGELASDVRETLGEGLQDVDRSSKPVEQVTTPNLDALRAYTLGTRANAESRQQDSLLHFEQALQLDPDFAMAMVSIGRIRLGFGRRDEALAEFARAAALRERLSEREWLSLQALVAMVEQRTDYPDRWRVFLELYPDHYAAAHNLALISWYDNRFEDALHYASRAAAPQSVTRLASTYFEGVAHTGLGDTAAARQAFELAIALGYSSSVSGISAGARAADRNFELARQTLRAAPSDHVHMELDRRKLELTFAADQGLWNELPGLAARVEELAVTDPGVGRWSGHAARLAVARGPESGAERRRLIEELLETGETALTAEGHVDTDALVAGMLYAAYVLARDGDAERATAVVERLQPVIATMPLQVHERIAAVVLARVDYSRQDFPRAAARLEALIDGAEPMLARAVLADALAAQGRYQEARNHAYWVANARGRAYAEHGPGYVFRTENVIQTNRALLRLADLHLLLGEHEQAAEWLARLGEVWPDLTPFPDLQAEVDRLQAAIISP